MGVYVYVLTRKVVAKIGDTPVYGCKFAYKPWNSYDGQALNDRAYNKLVAPSDRAWDKAGGPKGALFVITDENNKPHTLNHDRILVRKFTGNRAGFYDEPRFPDVDYAYGELKGRKIIVQTYVNKLYRKDGSNPLHAASFTYRVGDGGRIHLQDLNKGKSLTNDVQGVLNELVYLTGAWDHYGQPLITYKDSMGRIDRIHTKPNSNAFLEFGVALPEDYAWTGDTDAQLEGIL